MNIRIRLMGHDLPVAGFNELSLNDNSTVEDALLTYLEANDVGLGIKELSKSQFIVNKAHCSIQHPLKDQDELTVIRYLGGG